MKSKYRKVRAVFMAINVSIQQHTITNSVSRNVSPCLHEPSRVKCGVTDHNGNVCQLQ